MLQSQKTTTTTAVSRGTKLDTDILTYLQDQHCHETDAVMLVEALCDDGDGAGNVRLNRLSEDELQAILSLSFDFCAGHVGYLGDEVRDNTARYQEEQEHGQHRETIEGRDGATKASSHPKIPAAAYLLADRRLAIIASSIYTFYNTVVILFYFPMYSLLIVFCALLLLPFFILFFVHSNICLFSNIDHVKQWHQSKVRQED
jgi:hypothetical protein